VNKLRLLIFAGDEDAWDEWVEARIASDMLEYRQTLDMRAKRRTLHSPGKKFDPIRVAAKVEEKMKAREQKLKDSYAAMKEEQLSTVMLTEEQGASVLDILTKRWVCFVATTPRIQAAATTKQAATTAAAAISAAIE
jgi:hypothetical protein